MRILNWAVAVALVAAVVSPVLAVSKASASDCHYTSQDKKKGYKC